MTNKEAKATRQANDFPVKTFKGYLNFLHSKSKWKKKTVTKQKTHTGSKQMIWFMVCEECHKCEHQDP